MQLNSYLTFAGNCEEAFRFYESLFHGRIEFMMTHENTPVEADTPPEWRKKILHARMSIGDSVLMGSDAPPDRYSKPQGFSMSVGVSAPEEAERIFAALLGDGSPCMPIQETFWAKRFGMVTDRFGTPWMVSCEKEVTA